MLQSSLFSKNDRDLRGKRLQDTRAVQGLEVKTSATITSSRHSPVMAQFQTVGRRKSYVRYAGPGRVVEWIPIANLTRQQSSAC